jgi:putative SOS response-associated peptidase YedK
MCGRYTHLLTWSKIVELYRLTLPDEEPAGLKPNYNVAPTDVMPIIHSPGTLQ